MFTKTFVRIASLAMMSGVAPLERRRGLRPRVISSPLPLRSFALLPWSWFTVCGTEKGSPETDRITK
jgi:hypothetical protein